MEKVLDKFLRYVSYETTSDPESNCTPSNKLELVLANQLLKELKDLGIDSKLDDKGIVYGHIPGNDKEHTKKIGFIAHMDTSPDASGKDIKAKIVKNYDGKDILLNEKENIVMKVSDFPYLLAKKGEDLVVTDGTTLLGADDKAGVASIMSAIEYIINNKDFKHGDINIAFTPDEEVGRGTENFDVKYFNSDFAYTIDGAAVDCIEYENFNAASALVKINGRNIHPGSAKNKMVNSILLAMEFNSLLPANQTPETTEGYEGFYHLMNIKGEVEETTLAYILRNHDENILNNQKKLMQDCADFINKKYNGEWIKVNIKDSYKNMKSLFKDKMYIVDIAKDAMRKINLNPYTLPIRGGTDGANLTYMGLPCPNLGAGGYNFHGKYEYLSINEMEKAVKLILKIIEIAK